MAAELEFTLKMQERQRVLDAARALREPWPLAPLVENLAAGITIAGAALAR
jgi:hypothetical protein